MRTGEIAVDLARPLDLQLSWWVRDLGRAAFALPTRGLAPLLVGALTIGVALLRDLDLLSARPGESAARRLGELPLPIRHEPGRLLDYSTSKAS